LAEDIVNPKPARSILEAGDEIDEKTIPVLAEAGHDTFKVLDIDHVNVGAYIRNTLAADKNESRQDALFDIYRVMRPGEPPTMETAEAMFQSLFFDSERYDLSAVGRVKMNMRLDLDAEDTVRVLAQGRHHRRGQARWSTCATARAKSTTSTTSATAACARSAS
jgi:DNA-directed RNA polymerase subunit beta